MAPLAVKNTEDLPGNAVPTRNNWYIRTESQCSNNQHHGTAPSNRSPPATLKSKRPKHGHRARARYTITPNVGFGVRPAPPCPAASASDTKGRPEGRLVPSARLASDAVTGRRFGRGRGTTLVRFFAVFGRVHLDPRTLHGRFVSKPGVSRRPPSFRSRGVI